ncbi:hypothetical protein E5D57_009342 [Metarhizium anisopliae]|nr:hypothetical protein E5D57_009342 [Metarhizium anisopliae]
MLVISPDGRNSAQGCYRTVKELPGLILNTEACDSVSDVLWRNASIVYRSDTSTDEQSTIRLRRAPVANAGDTDIDEQSTDGISSTDSSCGNYETRRRSAAPPPSSRRLETRSNLKRSTTETAPQSPRSKRRGRPSVSQLLGYPCPHLLDAEPDDEAAEVAALLQGFKNGLMFCC